MMVMILSLNHDVVQRMTAVAQVNQSNEDRLKHILKIHFHQIFFEKYTFEKHTLVASEPESASE